MEEDERDGRESSRDGETADGGREERRGNNVSCLSYVRNSLLFSSREERRRMHQRDYVEDGRLKACHLFVSLYFLLLLLCVLFPCIAGGCQ